MIFNDIIAGAIVINPIRAYQIYCLISVMAADIGLSQLYE